MTMGNKALLLLLVAVLMLCLVHLSSSCVERERRALLTFKHSLIDPSNRLSSWVGQNCCDWDGVWCDDKSAHVVQLILRNDGWHNSSLVGSAVDPSLMELKHLEWLDLSGNNFAGSEIPKFIGNFNKLRYLKLPGARFGGAVPASLGNLSNLEVLQLQDNSLTGVVSEFHFDGLSRLESLDLSLNSLVFKISSNWTPPFQLRDLDLRSCLVGPRFPHWLRNQSRIKYMYLSNASISDSIPEWFPKIASNFGIVDLSYNQIHGPVPDLSRIMSMTNSASLSLYLSSNHFQGPLPPFPSSTGIIDISNNFVSGSLPQNISDMMPDLRVLLLSNNSISGTIPTSLCKISLLAAVDLSNNKFSGGIPRNCWNNFEYLNVLDLANNNLTGVLPINFSELCQLVILRLSNNSFYGEIPSALRQCQQLEIFDIGENGLSGNIPSWIGQLSNLAILRLRSNRLEGSIVPELCLAENIRILDLAENKFSGSILPCFKNFTGMKLGYELRRGEVYYDYLPGLNQEMKGRELLYTSTLPFLVNLDLSSNDLHGLIPKELTLLNGLRGLNLSNNQLTGGIPNEIGNLSSLESLDFSTNLLTGAIPQSISELTSISYLDFSYNNLSGRIPTGRQLQTLEPWIYKGNPNLCGTQVEKLCVEDEPIRRNNADDQVKNEDFQKVWFYISMIIGFVAGFWGVWGVLFCKKAWRATYFQFVENVHDLVLVKVGQICRA